LSTFLTHLPSSLDTMANTRSSIAELEQQQLQFATAPDLDRLPLPATTLDLGRLRGPTPPSPPPVAGLELLQ
ncbi:unnamed protein product, partial [Urochloa humidicola]